MFCHISDLQALYRFAVIFVGIADRARAGTSNDPEAANLAPLAERFALRALEIVGDEAHDIREHPR